MDDQAVIKEAIEFLALCESYDSNWTSQAKDDLRFRYGDQWSTQDAIARKETGRPQLVVNEMDTTIRQVVNQIRQQRPRIRCEGVNSEADERIAEVITGLTRHIEGQSDADHAYDTAVDFAVGMGKGFIRVGTDYESYDSDKQDIQIKTISNPFSVHFDPFSVLPDGSDQTKCLISEIISRDQFKRDYPTATVTDFTDGDTAAKWMGKDEVRVAEFFRIESKPDTLYTLQTGQCVLKSRTPKEYLDQMGIVKERPTQIKKVVWYKLTAIEVLERIEIGGRFIPIVPVYGIRYFKDDKIIYTGMVHNAKDAQRMLNFWQSAITELVGLAPKAKWLVVDGQTEGFENEWATANINATPTLIYKQSDVNGQPAPPPQRIQPEPPPSGAIELAMSASQNLKNILGVFDPAVETGGPKSGKAIRAEQNQSEITNFHFYDNLTRAIKQVGRIILDYIPIYYDTPRTLRIIGADGKAKLTDINTMNAVGKVLNDVRVGKYDVVMETGPGYDTKRQETVETMTDLLGIDPDLMKVAGDLIFRNMDFPGADVIADRLAAANPLSKIDEESDIPPQAQMLIQQLQQQIQQAQQQIQAQELEIKYRMNLEQMKQSAETQRTHMELVTKAHDVERRSESAMNDTVLRTHAEITREEIIAQAAILIARIEGLHPNGKKEEVKL